MHILRAEAEAQKGLAVLPESWASPKEAGMTRKQKMITQGIAIILLALWGGGYLIHLAGDQRWQFPAFMTAFFSAVGGYVWGAYGLIKVKD